MHRNGQFQRLSAEDLARDPGLVEQWRHLASSSKNLYALYQSPEWWEHLCATRDARDLVLVMFGGADGSLDGVVPMVRKRVCLDVSFGRFSIGPGSVEGFEVLGGEPLYRPGAGPDAEHFRWLAGSVIEARALYFKSVPDDGTLWSYLASTGWNMGGWLTSRTSPNRPFHSLELPGSFDDYVATFKKKRYNLKRQVRLMEEANEGQCRLELIAEESQVEGFIASVRQIVARSWKQEALGNSIPSIIENPVGLADVARRGLLRSYLLHGQSGPMAFVLGFQYGTVFHYADISYVQEIGHLSPGTVLLFLLIEDIARKSELKRINFGIEDRDYKRQFGNIHRQDTGLVMLRPGPVNSGRVVAHRAARVLKQRLKGAVSTAPAEE